MRTRTALRLAAVVLACQSLLASPAAAQFRLSGAQTFVAPRGTDVVLLQLTVGAAGFEGTSATVPFTASIFSITGNTLSGSSLFDQLLGRDVAGFVLTPNLELTPGGTYALVILPPPPRSGSWSTVTRHPTNTYEDGGYGSCRDATCTIFTQNDIDGFELTFGPTSVVPEPATWALLGTGLLVLGGATRARRRAARGA